MPPLVNGGNNRGITLIEMLVVLLIMGLLVSVTVLSTGILNRGDDSAAGAALRVAEDLSRLFEHASQQAVAKNEVLGWSMQDDQQMRWWRWSSAPSTQSSNLMPAPAWVQADESVMKIIDLPDNIELQVDAQNYGLPAARTSPAVVFFPGKEYSAFDIYVRNTESTKALARIWMERDGKIDWSAL